MAQARDVNRAKRYAGELLTADLRKIMVFMFFISGVINLLALTGSFYMLQVYDRAIPSGSLPTLAALSVLAIGLYLFQGLFDAIRSQILVRAGARIDKKIGPLAHRVAIDMPRFGFSIPESLERGRDVDTVRGFLGGQGPSAFFDLPWIPLYLGFVYILHPWLGAMTIAGALVLSVLAIISDILAKRYQTESRQAGIVRSAIADSNARNADILRAMGFADQAVQRYSTANTDHLELQTKASDITGTFAAISRVLRMLLQSALLGLGAYLTIKGELSAGAIIACTVAAGRALAPVDTAIAHWRGFVAARMAFQRLRETVAALISSDEPIDLPAPHRSVTVERLTVAAPSTGNVLLSDITFEVKAGQAVGIIGPSGSGKSTLIRAMASVWPLLRGHVRIDGADLNHWKPQALGAALGYLPQEVGLLDGNVAENISRLSAGSDDQRIVEAARAAGVHDLIVKLPDGYQTQLGPQGAALSAGQRQRVGLARALYGAPFLVLLDEPNSNLDAEGDAALAAAIEGVKKRGGIVIVVSHRPSALGVVDLVGVMQGGRMVAFGPRDEVLSQGGVVAMPKPKASNSDVNRKKLQVSA